MSTQAKVAPHLMAVSSVAMIIAAGLKTQGAVNRIDGALIGIPCLDIKKAEHFDELSAGLAAESSKLTGSNKYAVQVRDMIAAAVSLIVTMKRTFETMVAAGTTTAPSGANGAHHGDTDRHATK